MIRNALFLCVVCALVLMFFLPSYVRMQDLHGKNLFYEKKIHDLEQDNARLSEERRRLIEDPEYFERMARERMGLIKDGEVVYKVLGPGEGSPEVRDDDTLTGKSPEAEKPKGAVSQKVPAVKKTSVKASSKKKKKGPVKSKTGSSSGKSATSSGIGSSADKKSDAGTR